MTVVVTQPSGRTVVQGGTDRSVVNVDVIDAEVTVLEPAPATVVTSGGVVQGPAGPPGPRGEPGEVSIGTALGFRHVQDLPLDVWLIEHPLAFQPNVTVTDSGGSSVTGDVEYPTSTSVRISFSAAFAGVAVLS